MVEPLRYRKKPVVVQAVQVTDATFDDPHPNPEHIRGVIYDPRVRCAIVTTAQGQKVNACVGEWIIFEPDGRGHYPCAADIFAATYEPAPESGATSQTEREDGVKKHLADLGFRDFEISAIAIVYETAGFTRQRKVSREQIAQVVEAKVWGNLALDVYSAPKAAKLSLTVADAILALMEPSP